MFLISIASAGTLNITIQDVEHSRGIIRIGLVPEKNADMFLDGEGGYIQLTHKGITDTTGISIQAQKGTMHIKINVPNGAYAVALYHDENDNGKLDTTPLIGIPTEPIGFSNNPISAFGPPIFIACKFILDGSIDLEIDLK